MRFLVVTKQSTPPPPEIVISLLDGLSAWAKTHQDQGRIEQTWAFAGLPAGGGIFNVASLEELDTAMASFPFAPFSTIDIYPLIELEPSLETQRQAIRAMTPTG
jgi:muconolactone delta-isomerase